jgi:hypothetical protein
LYLILSQEIFNGYAFLPSAYPDLAGYLARMAKQAEAVQARCAAAIAASEKGLDGEK